MRNKDLLNTNDILHLLTTKLNFTPKQMGKSIFFLCPFHSDKNPSLSFEPSRKIFTCFSCGFKAGDIFDFWAQYRKIDLEESLVEISKFGYFSLANWQEEKKQEQKDKNNQESPKNNHLGLKIGLGCSVGVFLVSLIVVLVKRQKNKH